MLNYIEPKIAKDLLQARMECTALNLALNNAKKMKLNIKDTSPLQIRKAKAETAKKELEFKALSGLVTKEAVSLDKDWYAIAYYANKKNKKNNIRNLFITPIKNSFSANDICKRINSSKTNKNVEIQNPAFLLQDMIDKKILEEYKSSVNKYSLLVLEKLMKKDDNTEFSSQEFALENIKKDDKNFVITRHAYQRWCERIEKIQCENEKKTFIKINNIETKKEIIPRITASFNKSEKIYEKINDENIQYYLNKKDMIFFCVKEDNLLITIWKNDFGFADDINNQITLMQLGHIQSMKSDYLNKQSKNKALISEKDNNISEIEYQLDELNKRKKDLENDILEKELLKSNYNQEILDIKNKEMADLLSLNNQENKILKKFSASNTYNDLYGLDEQILLRNNNIDKLNTINSNPLQENTHILYNLSKKDKAVNSLEKTQNIDEPYIVDIN